MSNKFDLWVSENWQNFSLKEFLTKAYEFDSDIIVTDYNNYEEYDYDLGENEDGYDFDKVFEAYLESKDKNVLDIIRHKIKKITKRKIYRIITLTDKELGILQKSIENSPIVEVKKVGTHWTWDFNKLEVFKQFGSNFSDKDHKIILTGVIDTIDSIDLAHTFETNIRFDLAEAEITLDPSAKIKISLDIIHEKILNEKKDKYPLGKKMGIKIKKKDENLPKIDHIKWHLIKSDFIEINDPYLESLTSNKNFKTLIEASKIINEIDFEKLVNEEIKLDWVVSDEEYDAFIEKYGNKLEDMRDFLNDYF